MPSSEHVQPVSHLLRVCAGALLYLAALLPCQAQVASQGRGQLTLSIGEGSAPLGNVAAAVADSSSSVPTSTGRALAWRVAAGYQFADYVSAETAIAYITRIRSRAPYLTSDQITASTTAEIIELEAVGHIPLSSSLRLDLTAGAALTGLNDSLGTVLGNSLPPGQNGLAHSRTLGAVLALDAELRLSENVSLIAGDHLYPGAGSSSVVGVARGTLSILAAGIHVQF